MKNKSNHTANLLTKVAEEVMELSRPRERIGLLWVKDVLEAVLWVAALPRTSPQNCKSEMVTMSEKREFRAS